ncbi:MAG: hypothetical protein QNK04_26960 [Myxococcota bacterium]|nr:hypothetical protein [Myxococcota bacterium]
MSITDPRPTPEQLAWGLAEIFDELNVEAINEMLAKNVPIETLRFFDCYAEEFAGDDEMDPDTRRRLPNLMLLGYLLRVVEERVLGGEPEGEA